MWFGLFLVCVFPAFVFVCLPFLCLCVSRFLCLCVSRFHVCVFVAACLLSVIKIAAGAAVFHPLLSSIITIVHLLHLVLAWLFGKLSAYSTSRRNCMHQVYLVLAWIVTKFCYCNLCTFFMSFFNDFILNFGFIDLKYPPSLESKCSHSVNWRCDTFRFATRVQQQTRVP